MKQLQNFSEATEDGMSNAAITMTVKNHSTMEVVSRTSGKVFWEVIVKVNAHHNLILRNHRVGAFGHTSAFK